MKAKILTKIVSIVLNRSTHQGLKMKIFFENTNDQTKNLVTKNFGGLSTVWGSSISEISDLEKKEYINQNLNLDEPYLYLKSEMNFISKYKSFSKM